MRKNLYKFAALTMFAALSITACKKHEAVDISGIHTSAAETMAETTSNETKADPAADNSKSDSSKTDASKAGSSEVETPIETCMTPMLAGKKLAIVPILRAGLGMVNGVLSLVPSAKIGHIGLYRDEETHEPHEYFCKLPNPIEQRTIVVTDPMLATGGSAVAAIDFIKQHGGKHIKFMCIIAAPEGVKKLHEAHPDVQIYVGHLDRELNENAYICPGLGDAGDRIFGTK